MPVLRVMEVCVFDFELWPEKDLELLLIGLLSINTVGYSSRLLSHPHPG